MKYRKKPVVIDAFRWYVGAPEEKYPNWFLEAAARGDWWYKSYVGGYFVGLLQIDTLEGVMTAESGDYVIKGVHGELYSCKPDVFKETYERVGDTDEI